jgi:hypothetical protein
MIVILFIINIGAYFFLDIAKNVYLINKFKLSLINPISINFVLYFILNLFKVFGGVMLSVDGGLFNRYYQYALFITNVSLLFEYIAIVLSLKFFKRNHFLNLFAERIKCIKMTKRQKIVIVSIIFLFFSIVFFILLANTSYSIVEWIKNPRIGYQLHRQGAGQYYALFLLTLSISFTLVLLYVKNIKMTIILFFLYVFLIRLLGSKGQYLYFFIAFYSILWFRKYKYLVFLTIVFTPLVLFLMLINFGSFDTLNVLEYFDYYYNSTIYFEAYFNKRLELFHGKIFLTNFWGLVPRALYPNKPFVYGIIMINEYFYPGAAAATHTPAFGGPIAAFGDFGVLGVILSSLFNLNTIIRTYCYYLIFSKYNITQIKKNIFLVLVFLYIVAPSFLTYFQFPISSFLILVLFFMLNFSARFNYREFISLQ